MEEMLTEHDGHQVILVETAKMVAVFRSTEDARLYLDPKCLGHEPVEWLEWESLSVAQRAAARFNAKMVCN